MDEQTRKAFAKEFNRMVGELLQSLRNKAGLSLDHVAETIAAARLEKLKRLEAGAESLHGSDLMELVRIYGADPAEVNTSIQVTAMRLRSQLQMGNIHPR